MNLAAGVIPAKSGAKKLPSFSRKDNRTTSEVFWFDTQFQVGVNSLVTYLYGDKDAINPISRDYEKFILDLHSSEISRRVPAVEYLAGNVRDIVESVVGLLAGEPEGRFLVYERLVRFGSIAVEPLQRILANTTDKEVRVLAGAALLHFGNTIGVPHLLAAIQPGDPYVCLAVRVLSTSGTTEAIGHIERALRSPKLINVDDFQCLLNGLHSFGHPVPNDVHDRLSSIQPEWLRKSLLRKPQKGP